MGITPPHLRQNEASRCSSQGPSHLFSPNQFCRSSNAGQAFQSQPFPCETPARQKAIHSQLSSDDVVSTSQSRYPRLFYNEADSGIDQYALSLRLQGEPQMEPSATLFFASNTPKRKMFNSKFDARALMAEISGLTAANSSSVLNLEQLKRSPCQIEVCPDST
eukprot:gb/GEZN01017387.1/.p1 GENE.gb/GEZN01017387.1/~~gb/GEZN01017387.1/.p1  ORF type:complete len:163 (-),score=5.22 gb/GEZN01017387.1/:312-800(-)